MTLGVWIYQTMVRKDHPLQSCWTWSQRPELSPSCPETSFSLPQRWAPCLCNVFFSLQATGCTARAAGSHNKLHFSYLDKLLCPRYLSPVPLENVQCGQPISVLCTTMGLCTSGWRMVNELTSLFLFQKPQSQWFLSGSARKCLDHPLAIGSALTV